MKVLKKNWHMSKCVDFEDCYILYLECFTVLHSTKQDCEHYMEQIEGNQVWSDQLTEFVEREGRLE